eukprot:ctg_2401.g672
MDARSRRKKSSTPRDIHPHSQPRSSTPTDPTHRPCVPTRHRHPRIPALSNLDRFLPKRPISPYFPRTRLRWPRAPIAHEHFSPPGNDRAPQLAAAGAASAASAPRTGSRAAVRAPSYGGAHGLQDSQ